MNLLFGMLGLFLVGTVILLWRSLDDFDEEGLRQEVRNRQKVNLDDL